MKIKRPIDNYDVAGWTAYYKKFSGMKRAVGADGDADPDDPKVKAIVEAAVSAASKAHGEAIVGLKANSDKLLEENRVFKQKLEGVDLDKYKSWQDKMENDEETKLIADGKIDQVIGARTERMRGDFESKLNASAEELEKAKSSGDNWMGKFSQERISNALRIAAGVAGVLPEAMDDIIYRGRSIFSVDADGKIEARGQDGNLLMSKDGTSVLGTKEFITELKTIAPHYWPGSAGAGAGGGRSGGGGDNDFGALMNAAAAKNDMIEYRRLKAERAKAKAGK